MAGIWYGSRCLPKYRDAIRMIEQDGWYHVRTRGSHRQYHHPTKPGTVTVAGHPGDEVDKRRWHDIMRQAGLLQGKP
ncbi:MAG: type II toxin-antitoxin system HicA family toxin [Chloroflexota bacterium]|nr:type II toxin-antitoxin system HicA family toxin [Chloroflexota bacterium]MDE2968485.1 type II toxin-antitoxin system HicA family toxin [Chloroflexota bacterium]